MLCFRGIQMAGVHVRVAMIGAALPAETALGILEK
jgi:hypothetical protein